MLPSKLKSAAKPLIPTAPKTLKTKGKKAKLSEYSTLKEGYAKSRDGTRIWYQATGTGTPMIFCNGLGCSTFYWKHIQPYFKDKAQTIFLDWRAHGRSAEPQNPDKMTISDLTDDLYAVFKALKIQKAVILGHSMGVQVLFNFYDRYPEHVEALVPCFGTYGRPMDTFYNLNWSRYFFEFVYLFNHLFPQAATKLGQLALKNPLWYQIGGLLRMLNPGLADRGVLKQYLEHFTSVDPLLLAKLTRSMQDYDAEPLLTGVNVPTLIFAGERDQFTPVWTAKKMHRLIPHSEMQIIKKATHVGLIEQPELINLRLEKFMDARLRKKN